MMNTQPLHDCCSSSKSGERGAVLVLMAIAIVALLGLVALAVDLTMRFSNQAQSLDTAKLSTLAALQTFVAQPEGTSEEAREAAGLARFNTVLIETANTYGRGSEVTLATLPGSSTPAKLLLEFGIRYMGTLTDAGPGCENPCLNGESVTQLNDGYRGCFVPMARVNPACHPNVAPLANSARVTGTVFKDLPYEFGKVFGDKSYSTKVTVATSSLLRDMVFTVDLTNSAVAMTNPAYSGPGRPFKPFAVFLKKDNEASDGVNCGVSGPFDDLLDLDAEHPEYGKRWAALNPSDYAGPFTLGGSTPSDTRYISNQVTQIERRPINGSAPGNNPYKPLAGKTYFWNNNGGTVRFGFRDDWGDDFKGCRFRLARNIPMPLFAVLQGIKIAAEELKQSGNPGDRAGFMFWQYGNMLCPYCAYDLTTELNELADSLDFTTQFTSQGTLPETTLQLLAERGYFPLPTSRSDLLMADQVGYWMLTRRDGTNALGRARRLIHISDGIANGAFRPVMWLEDQGAYYNSFRWTGNLLGNAREDAGASPVAGTFNSIGQFMHARMLERLLFYNDFVPQRISVDFISYGAGVNRLNLQDPENPGTCMTDAKARSTTMPKYPGRTPGAPYRLTGSWDTCMNCNDATKSCSSCSGDTTTYYNQLNNLLARKLAGQGTGPDPLCFTTESGFRIYNPYYRLEIATYENENAARITGGGYYPILTEVPAGATDPSGLCNCNIPCNGTYTSTGTGMSNVKTMYFSCVPTEVQIAQAMGEILRSHSFAVFLSRVGGANTVASGVAR